MKQPLVKICGITNIDDAGISLEMGADFLGFNFFEKSPRYINPDHAGKIIRQLKSKFKFKSVGILVNPEKEFADEAISLSKIDILQFHGDETPEFLDSYRIKKIKVFRIKDGSEIGRCSAYNADYFLFDTYTKETYGGTGKTFDWNILSDISIRDRLFLSGGLNAENIIEAVKKINPFAVDLSSGLEKSPGKKDPGKIKEFFLNLRSVK